jgi:probable F420-dependent oxidoreductase
VLCNGPVNVGLSVYDMPPRDVLELARAADDFGFDALWLGEHVLLPLEYGSEHPSSGQDHEHITGPIIEPLTELLDPWVSLGAVVGATRHLRVATGIYILPLRHPLITARAASTLHDMSAGRFLLGVGMGWLAEEFDALAIPFSERASRFEETIEILRAAWRGEPFEHSGSHFAFDRVRVTTRPVDIPIVMGGNGPKALRRAARLGDAWFSSGTPTFEQAAALRLELEAVRASHGRQGPFRCYFRVPDFDPDAIDKYASEGIDDVVVWADQVWPLEAHPDERRDLLRRAAGQLGLSARRRG